MCGIAGYSIERQSDVKRTLAAQVLLAAIAERGADAVGYAYRTSESPVHVQKQRTGASALIDRIDIADDATQALVHVRDYTKGHPTIEMNNHPIRHGSVVGIHNGIIVNDEDIFEEHRLQRAHPEMTVDSEAIFALAQYERSPARALEKLRGSMAAAWLDEREPDVLFCARGVGRPLWLGEGAGAAFFASTEQALNILERYVGVELTKREVPEGTFLALCDGAVVTEERFNPDRRFEERLLPAVRAPQEAKTALQRLQRLATA
jgi:glucosamine 6-phosphate synthetase-like amidotransferase/phosphosugar isomerase protein